MKAKVICSFFGTGKTYINKNYPNFIDFEVHYFGNRLDLLVKAIKDASNVYGYNVLVACTKPIIELLKENNIDFVAVLPDKEQKEEYMERYRNRNSNPEVIKGLEQEFDNYIDGVMSCDCYKIILEKGQYLNDVIGDIV